MTPASDIELQRLARELAVEKLRFEKWSKPSKPWIPCYPSCRLAKYMGVVTDHFWKVAVTELYPNRKANHPDQHKRKAMAMEKRDIPELAMIFQAREQFRAYDVPLANLDQPRWQKARSYHLFGYCSVTDKNVLPMGCLIDRLAQLKKGNV